jgi:hypothetical protein
MHSCQSFRVMHRGNPAHHNELRDSVRQKGRSGDCRRSPTGDSQNTETVDPKMSRYEPNIISPIFNPSLTIPIGPTEAGSIKRDHGNA